MWATILSWVLSNVPAKGLVVIGGALLVAALGAGWWYVDNKITTLESAVVEEKARVNQLKEDLVKQRIEMHGLILAEVNKQVNKTTKVEVISKTEAKVDKKADPIEAVIFSF